MFNPVKSAVLVVSALALAAGLAACTPKSGGSAPSSAAGSVSSQPPVRAVQQPDSVLSLMGGVVDPSADNIWGAVATVETPQGVDVRRPRTDEDWRKLRVQALALIDGAKRLGAPPPVAPPGQVLADASTPGIRTAADIQKTIDGDPAKFRAKAQKLQAVGQSILAEIDARNPDAVIAAGEALDAACESCHVAYWYPHAAPMALPSPEAFAKLPPPQ